MFKFGSKYSELAFSKTVSISAGLSPNTYITIVSGVEKLNPFPAYGLSADIAESSEPSAVVFPLIVLAEPELSPHATIDIVIVAAKIAPTIFFILFFMVSSSIILFLLSTLNCAKS